MFFFFFILSEIWPKNYLADCIYSSFFLLPRKRGSSQRRAQRTPLLQGSWQALSSSPGGDFGREGDSPNPRGAPRDIPAPGTRMGSGTRTTARVTLLFCLAAWPKCKNAAGFGTEGPKKPRGALHTSLGRAEVPRGPQERLTPKSFSFPSRSPGLSHALEPILAGASLEGASTPRLRARSLRAAGVAHAVLLQTNRFR